MRAFSRTIGIDYSGAETPSSSLKGLRAYLTEGDTAPAEVMPSPSPRKHWTRRGIAEWLVAILAEDIPTIVGINHGFSFPLAYFERYDLPPDWPSFLDDFQRHWPTDEDYAYVDFIRDGTLGQSAARQGDPRWQRLTEMRIPGAKHVFQFEGLRAGGKPAHAGLPWLRFMRQRLGRRVHFWPFDGWEIPADSSAIVEVYAGLWSRGFAQGGRSADQHDAFSIAAWLAQADHDGRLAHCLQPRLSMAERAVARVEGWILGAPGPDTPSELADSAHHVQAMH